MENLRVLEGSEVFFRGLQHLYHQFKSGWRLRESGEYPGFFYTSIQNIHWIFLAKRLKSKSVCEKI